MDNSKEAMAARIVEWSEKIKEREESGMTIPDFCQIYDISVSKYNYWAKRIKQSKQDNEPTEIVDVTAVAKDEDTPIKLVTLAKDRLSHNKSLDVLMFKVTGNTPFELIAKIIKAANDV